jgi:hypothetical protein
MTFFPVGVKLHPVRSDPKLPSHKSGIVGFHAQRAEKERENAFSSSSKKRSGFFRAAFSKTHPGANSATDVGALSISRMPTAQFHSCVVQYASKMPYTHTHTHTSAVEAHADA